MDHLTDRDSFSEFYEEWYPRAVRMAAKIVHRDPEAAAQDVMMVLFTHDYIEQWDPSRENACSFRRWVESIMRRKLISIRRYQSRNGRLAEDLVGLLPEYNRVPELAAEAQKAQHLAEFKLLARDVSRRLREKYGEKYGDLWRELIWLVVKKGDTARYVALAEQLHVSPRTVAKQMDELRDIIHNDPEIALALYNDDRESRSSRTAR